MKTNKIPLKVKIKSLAVEARIIKREEGKTKDPQLKNSLRFHRTYDVRKEARSAHLAYAFLKGFEYAQIESRCNEKPDFVRIKKLVEKFGRCYHYEEDWDTFKKEKVWENEKLTKWIERANQHLWSRPSPL